MKHLLTILLLSLTWIVLPEDLPDLYEDNTPCIGAQWTIGTTRITIGVWRGDPDNYTPISIDKIRKYLPQ